MAIQHNRLRIDGSLGTQEVFSCSVAFDTDTHGLIVENGDLLDWAQSTWGLIENDDALSIFQNALSTEGKITAITMGAYDSDGDLIDQATYSEAGGIPGLGTQTKPYQCAIVVSHLGPVPGGRRRGRIYWPALGAGIAVNRLVSPTLPVDLAAQWATFLGDVSTLAGLDGMRAITVSRVGNFVTPITTVRVGDIIDTQRRRRDDITENFVTAVV